MNSLIDDYRIMTDTEQCFKKVLENIAAERNYNECKITITPISSGGANYTSELFTATIAGQGKDEHKRVLNLFGKVAILSQEKRDEVGFATSDTENYVYTTLLKKYREIEDMYGVSGDQRLNVPEFYAYDPTYSQGTLVLEDLFAAGYEARDRFILMEWKYAQAAVSELAKFHALGFAFKAMYPVEYNEMFASGNLDFKLAIFDALREDPAALALDNVKPEYRDMLKKFMDKYMGNYAELFKPEFRAVLSHADFKSYNLMYKRRENGAIAIKIVDFQSVSEASPIRDLLSFIFSGLDEGFRSTHLTDLTDNYYTELSAAMMRYDLKPEVVYSRDMFNAELKLKLPFGLCLALVELPYLILGKEGNLSTMVGADLRALILKPGKGYAERLNGLIEDFLKWGVLQ